jgi:nucleotide-binding universal stress UspA family protein
MFRTILVPLDGSSFAEQALPWALSLARRAGANLDLVQVHVPYVVKDPTPRGIPYDPALEDKSKRQVQLYLASTAKWVGAMAAVPMTTAVMAAQEVDGILERLQAHPAHLIVMTTHGRGALGRFFLGGIADALLRRVKVPLLLVRPREPAPTLIPEPVTQDFLIPLDGSALAEQILEPALELARLMDARCTLLRLVEIRSSLPDAPPGSSGPTGEVHVEEAQAYLARVARRLRERGRPIQTEVVLARNVPDTILEQARRHGGAVIALATHGRGGIGRMLLGSVADKVIQGAAMPVMVYRPSPG